MDSFENRLKQDADAIAVEVSPALRGRIDASLRSIEPVAAESVKSRYRPTFWLASSLTGIAAAAIVIAVVNRDPATTDPVPEATVQLQTEPDLPDDLLPSRRGLEVQAAQFASPLEEELRRLQADIEKARNSVREDIDFTF